MSHKQEKFQKYLDMYEKMILNNASRYVGYDLAQDVTQETLLKMFLHIDYLDDQKIKPWLLVVSQNMAVNAMKKITPAEELTEETLDGEAGGQGHGDSTEDYCIKKEAVHELLRTAFEVLYEKNPTWYEVMLDSYVLDMSSKEVSKVLNLSVANVDVIKLRARTYLSKMLGKRYREIF